MGIRSVGMVPWVGILEGLSNLRDFVALFRDMGVKGFPPSPEGCNDKRISPSSLSSTQSSGNHSKRQNTATAFVQSLDLPCLTRAEQMLCVPTW